MNLLHHGLPLRPRGRVRGIALGEAAALDDADEHRDDGGREQEVDEAAHGG